MKRVSRSEAGPLASLWGQHTGLWLIVLGYCVLVTLYAVFTPPWESPDEPAHYLYVSQLARRWRPPSDPGVRQTNNFWRDYPYVSSNYEWYQPALGYVQGAWVYSLIDWLAPATLPEQIPPLNPQPGESPNLFVHQPMRPWTVWKGVEGLLILRITSSLLGVIPILAAYRIGRLLLGDISLGLVAAGWVAFLPQFTFISGSVRSDTTANAVGALVCMLAVEMIFQKPRPARIAVLGGILGLGLLTKYTFLYLIPVGCFAVLLSVKDGTLRQYASNLLTLLIPLFLIVAAYFLSFEEARAALAYTYNHELTLLPHAFSWNYLKRIPEPLFIDLFFARFGWANVVISNFWARLSFGLWCAFAIITFVGTLSLYRDQATEGTFRALVLLWSAFILACAGALRYNLSVLQPQGRFLFPVLPAWAVLGFWGIFKGLRSRGVSIATKVSVLYMGLFDLFALITLYTAYYR